MTPLPLNASDAELIEFLDRWAALLEGQDYESAHALPDYARGTAWTPALIQEAIERHGERVTLDGDSTGGRPQLKEVTRWPTKPDGSCGDVWYDLYVDRKISDLTATFELRASDGGLTLHLIDIGVM